MFCRNCQTIIPDDSLFCENCGAPTGLDPDQIDDSNLVPEEAVEYEIVEDEEPVQTVSVPVDPVWWEPPEGEDAPIDVEAEEVLEEPLPPEDDDFAKAGAAGYEAQPESPAEETAEAAEEEEGSFAEETGAKLQDIASGALGLGKSLLEKVGSAGASIIDRIDGDDDEAMKATQQWEKAAWEEAEAAEESEEPAKPAKPAEPAEEPAQAAPEPEEPSVSMADEASAWFWGTSAGPQKRQTEQTETETEQEGEQELFDEGEEAGSDGAEKAKIYAAKAKSWLEDLGKVVHTGTGKAMVAAREQLQQKKEEYEEQREQREQQRAQEKKEKEAEQKRKERERQELEKQREREMRTEENVIQQPGFWYGDNMPKPTIAIAPAIKADHHPAETETRESVKEEPSDDEVPEAPDEELDEAEAEAEAADVPDGEQAEAGSGAEAELKTEAEPETEAADGPDGEQAEAGSEAEVELKTEAEPEPLSEDFIEDKLANTARFGWSREELDAAVAAEAAAAGKSEADASAEDASDPDASPANASETGETADADSKTRAAEKEEKAEKKEEEEIPPDEPVLYRIQDFGPSKPIKKERKPFDKSRWKMIAIIAGILMVIALVAGIMIHQAHVRQLEEEAYQAALVQAHQLAGEEKYEDAEALYLKLIDQRPEDTEPYLGLAQMYVDQQRYVDAKALIKGAIEATGNEEAFEEIKKEIKTLTSRKWKKAYIKVLEEYETDIRSYEEDVTASVAVCDINGDLKPELFFFTKEYYGYGKLHIYTTIKNKAKEVNYECENKGTQYHDAFYDVSSSDSSYAIFNEKENEKFAIYANITTDGRSWDTINEYRLNLQGGCRQLRVIQGSIDTNYDENGNSNSTYLQDGEDISYEKYVAEFQRVLDQVKQVILYNGGDGDQAVWSKIKPENVMCMSYDAMMVDLKAK